MPLYIYRSLFRDKKPDPPTVLIDGYSDTPVKKPRVMHSCTPHWEPDTTESSIPGYRHKRIPDPWP